MTQSAALVLAIAAVLCAVLFGLMYVRHQGIVVGPYRASIFPIRDGEGSINCNNGAADSFGNVWLAGCNNSLYVSYFRKGDSFRTIALPYRTGTYSVSADNKGGVWYTAILNPVASKRLASAVFEFENNRLVNVWHGSGNTNFSDIAVDSNGNVWLTSSSGNLVGSVDKIIGRRIVTIVSALRGIDPERITVGNSHEVWFSSPSTNQIGRITQNGSLMLYNLRYPNSGPGALTLGPDKSVWFTEATAHRIGRISRSGTLTEFLLPDGHEPLDIAAGKDGNLWFTEPETNLIGRITPSGQVAEYVNPGDSGHPSSINRASDGSLWIVSTHYSWQPFNLPFWNGHKFAISRDELIHLF